MPIHLECLRGAQPGRRLAIRADKPLTIRTQKSDEDAGEIQIELRGGLCVLANRSRMLCTVNGKERTEAVLAAGDEVVIGKQVFRLVVDDDDAESTQQLDAMVAAVAASDRQFCSVCDALFDAEDARRGWTDGARRICRTCMSKGVGPEHLPRPAASPSAEEPAVLGSAVSPLAANLEDQLHVEEPVTGPVASASTTTAHPLASADESTTEAGRRSSRRISASRLAQVEPAPVERGGLFKRVGAVFGGGREERKRMEQLEAERDELLRDAGRASLKGNGGYGLSDAAMAVLMQGAALSVRRSDLAQGELERWRSLAARLDLIDAEIAALRKRLKLGLDPAQARKGTLPPLRTDQRAHEERTFQVLDDLGTEDLDEVEDMVEAASDAPPPLTPKPAPQQAAQRPPATRPVTPPQAAPRPASAPHRDSAAAKAPTAGHPRTPPAPAKASPPAAKSAQRARHGGDGAKSGEGGRRKLPRRRH